MIYIIFFNQINLVINLFAVIFMVIEILKSNIIIVGVLFLLFRNTEPLRRHGRGLVVAYEIMEDTNLGNSTRWSCSQTTGDPKFRAPCNYIMTWLQCEEKLPQISDAERQIANSTHAKSKYIAGAF